MAKGVENEMAGMLCNEVEASLNNLKVMVTACAGTTTLSRTTFSKIGLLVTISIKIIECCYADVTFFMLRIVTNCYDTKSASLIKLL